MLGVTVYLVVSYFIQTHCAPMPVMSKGRLACSSDFTLRIFENKDEAKEYARSKTTSKVYGLTCNLDGCEVEHIDTVKSSESK